MQKEKHNPFDNLLTEIEIAGAKYRYYDIKKLNDDRVTRLPVSIKVLLECAIRNCDGFSITEKDVAEIIDWEKSSTKNVPTYLSRHKSLLNPPESSSKISPVYH